MTEPPHAPKPWPAKLAYGVLGTLLIALYVSILMKADLGTSAYDAFACTGGLLLGMKMGTFSILINTLLVAIQALFQGRQVKLRLLSQFFIVFGFGLLVNWIFYELFAGWQVQGYISRLLLLLAGVELKALGMLVLFKAEFICCPIDGFSLELSKKLHKNFDKVRQGVEIAFLVLVCIITLLAKTPWTIREGTILDALLIGPALALNRWLLRPRRPRRPSSAEA